MERIGGRGQKSGDRVKKSAPRRTTRCDDPPPAALLQGIEEFNRQEFFEQHETLEAIWIHEPDPVRYLYQGILQVGVGFYHWRQRNWRGAVAKLGQGVAKLQPYRPACMDIDVERLVRETEAILEQLQHAGLDGLPSFPPPRLPQVHRLSKPASASGHPSATGKCE